MSSGVRESVRSATPSLDSDLDVYYDQVPSAHRMSNLSTSSGLRGQYIPPASASSSVINLTALAPARTRPHFGDRRVEIVHSTYYVKGGLVNRQRIWILASLAVVGSAIVIAVIAVIVSTIIVLSRKKSTSSN
ncbi:hypothetical protein EV368DRAFT_86007 [Lentinula lateritia]|nr:hypothetical protein EV368DRAFT_86007 [Lentinula lateritia]